MSTLISTGTVSVKVDNFGQKITGSLQYDLGKVGLDCNYDGQIYKFQANFPAFNLKNANIALRVETPIDNYRLNYIANDILKLLLNMRSLLMYEL